MKNPHRLLITALLAALALPAAALAAKGDKKNDADKPAAFGKMDTDGNGSISESEYVAATKSGSSEDAAKSKFATLDKNHDGKLDKKELGGAGKGDGEKKGRKKKNQQ